MANVVLIILSLLLTVLPETPLKAQKQKSNKHVSTPSKQKAENTIDKQSLVYVQGGGFDMGCTTDQAHDCFDDEKPSHHVILKSFYIGCYDVTVAEFEEFVNTTNYKTDAEKVGYSYIWNASHWEKKAGICWRNTASGGHYDNNDKKKFPVVHVSWNDAKEYCNWLSSKTGKQYRLPTEAEWEYAAKGGNKSSGYKYPGSNDIDQVAWYKGNSNSDLHPVGQKSPNELMLYDMSGNVNQWCSDWYGAKYYQSSPIQDPLGIDSGQYRAIRGGSWNDESGCCRVSIRGGTPPNVSGNSIGFRLVRN
jgi:formylglycine-generating enzyme required for sulfatase activity